MIQICTIFFFQFHIVIFIIKMCVHVFLLFSLGVGQQLLSASLEKQSPSKTVSTVKRENLFLEE